MQMCEARSLSQSMCAGEEQADHSSWTGKGVSLWMKLETPEHAKEHNETAVCIRPQTHARTPARHTPVRNDSGLSRLKDVHIFRRGEQHVGNITITRLALSHVLWLNQQCRSTWEMKSHCLSVIGLYQSVLSLPPTTVWAMVLG